ncbi:hypothetical protein IAI10_16720 [Clostridium sp. 19966]|uniref:hypothetical protein n=1 Tax=Clostridium sp. 19966 TaxID=2768166 RepID=UPI0028DE2FAF|nr:hypothetical protein [Clostridium sp. 19966]MDT8718313.1 hypothetical protein [Clostridium sp. 19966]
MNKVDIKSICIIIVGIFGCVGAFYPIFLVPFNNATKVKSAIISIAIAIICFVLIVYMGTQDNSAFYRFFNLMSYLKS